MNKASTFLLTILSAWLIVGPAAGYECRHAPIAGAYSKYRVINHQRCWYSSAHTGRATDAVTRYSSSGRLAAGSTPARSTTVRRHVHHQSSGRPSNRSMPDQRAADPASNLAGEGWTPAEQIEMRWPTYDGSFRQSGMVQ